MSSEPTTHTVPPGDWTTPRLPIDAGTEHIYGLEFEARGPAGAVIRPTAYRTYRADGALLQRVPIEDRLDTYRTELHAGWQTGRFDAFTRRGSAWLELELRIGGPGPVEIGGIQVVEGGFPSDPPPHGAPYVVWIDALRAAPALTTAELLPEIPAEDGVGVRLSAPGASAVAFYRKPESAAPFQAAGLSGSGRFIVWREAGGETSLDLYDGTSAAHCPVSVQIAPWPELPVLGLGEENGEHLLLVRGSLPGYPTDPARQPHAGGHVCFRQQGQSARWLPLARVEPGDGGTTRLVLALEPGFTYDPERQLLRERDNPYRVLAGAASVQMPGRVNLRWQEQPGGHLHLRVRASGDVRLVINGPWQGMARVRPAGESAWREIPLVRLEYVVTLDLPLAVLGRGWCEAELR